MLSLLLWTCGLLCVAYAERNEDLRLKAMENPDLFGGDMVGVDPNDRSVVPQKHLRWTGAVVPYVIDPALKKHVDVIKQAFQDYHARTCIRFVERTNQQNYLRLFEGNGCYSNIGMTGGQQVLSLGNGCRYVGTILHELGHALGVYHEQNRSDRDDYLILYLQNVEKGQEHNFIKLRPEQNLLLTPFDYDSIMIYGSDSFSKDGSDTMRAKDGRKLIHAYYKKRITDTDAVRINKMYNCQ